MRAALLNTFDDIYVLNLNGSTKRRDKAPDGTLDQNVFDIQQGVAISLFVRRGDELSDGTKRVSYYSLRGPRRSSDDSNAIGKYEWLDAHSVLNTEMQLVDPIRPDFWFVPRNKVIQDMTLGTNIAICTARSVEVASGWNHVLAVNSMVQHHAVSTKEVNHLFPLWVYHSNLGATDRHHNLDPAVVAALSERLAVP